MSADSPTQKEEQAADKAISCIGWLALFALPGALAIALVVGECEKWLQEDDLQWSRNLMAEQVEQIKRGKIHCLVQPDPRLIEEVLADTTCAAKIQEVDLGGDVSDERFARLRELPNLKCIVLLFAFADKPDAFLERLQGMVSLEHLNSEHTGTSRHSVELMGSFPNLKSLSLAAGNKVSDLNGIRNHPTIENLVLTRAGSDVGLIQFLQSLPRLRSVTIEDANIGNEKDAECFEQSLRNALPKCRCSVQLGG